ncbi:unnamed protein product [Sphacelaria rigidula]
MDTNYTREIDEVMLAWTHLISKVGNAPCFFSSAGERFLCASGSEGGGGGGDPGDGQLTHLIAVFWKLSTLHFHEGIPELRKTLFCHSRVETSQDKSNSVTKNYFPLRQIWYSRNVLSMSCFCFFCTLILRYLHSEMTKKRLPTLYYMCELFFFCFPIRSERFFSHVTWHLSDRAGGRSVELLRAKETDAKRSVGRLCTGTWCCYSIVPMFRSSCFSPLFLGERRGVGCVKVVARKG